MLVLSRRKEERVRLRVAGVELWITVADIEWRGGRQPKVKLAFTAPAAVEILREELCSQQLVASRE